MESKQVCLHMCVEEEVVVVVAVHVEAVVVVLVAVPNQPCTKDPFVHEYKDNVLRNWQDDAWARVHVSTNEVVVVPGDCMVVVAVVVLLLVLELVVVVLLLLDHDGM